MVAGFAARFAAPLEAAGGRDICLVTDDWIQPGGAARFVKLDCTVEVAVVGDCQRVHPQLFRPIDHPVDRASAVEQAVVAVAMQMNKRRRGSRRLLPEIEASNAILSRRQYGCHDTANPPGLSG